MGGRTCGTCATHWRAREARWCGRCGAPLVRATRERDRRGRWHLVAAGTGLAAAALLLALGGNTWPLPPQGPADTTVALPERPAERASPEAQERAAVQCRSGTFCTEIDTTSAHRGPYLGAATGELLVLVEGRGLSAYELTTGARRWHLDLAINPMHPVPRVATVDGEAAVAVASPAGEVVAVDTRQGRIRWREPAPGIEDVFAVRADGESWLATVRTRRDNTSMLDVVTLPPAGDPPAPGHGADEPDLDHVAAGLRTARCCEALVAAAARDGLDLRRADGVPGGLIQVLHADTGRHVADLSLATYHGQRLAQGRWLFVAPHRAVVVTTRPAA